MIYKDNLEDENFALSEGGGNILPIDLDEKMRQSYLDYAMSVIIGRALPDVRDGLKPVHRRVIYAMYAGGYRPNKAFSKCSRVVGEVMGQFHPHGDSAIYDTLVRLVQDWSLRYPLALGQGNFGSPGDDSPAAPRYTETKMAPIAMELVADIEEDTVDFQDNYDGKTQEPTVLPSRIPNLLINGSVGIAVGMATNIPPHNLKEVSDAAIWFLENYDAPEEEKLKIAMQFIKGPDFPTKATILGISGIRQAYETGRGSIIMRAVVDIEEINKRTCLVVKELPYQVNPDNVSKKIAELVKENKISGIADIRDETSGRHGQRLVIVLKRDASPKVVLNNLYKHTQLQENFGANMIALVDGVPKTLNLEQFISYWLKHQIEVIVRRTKFRLQKAKDRAHILEGYLKALDKIDEVIALIRASKTVEDAKNGLKKLLDIDDTQAVAILDMQLRRLAALERQKILDEFNELQEQIKDYEDILGSDIRQRKIIADELKAISDKYSDKRRTQIDITSDPNVDIEDLISEEECVITVSKSGYIKRTNSNKYRSQHRGGKGIKGATLRTDDIVEHFFVTTTHHYLLMFSDKGRVYRIKTYEIPETERVSKGMHIANLVEMAPDESIAQILDIKEYDNNTDLILATEGGIVKKTNLIEYKNISRRGLLAIKLKDGDRLIAAFIAKEGDEILMASKDGLCIRFAADSLNALSRNTQGVKGISLNQGDKVLTATIISQNSSFDKQYIFIATDKGFAKRSDVDEYRSQSRAGKGIKIAKFSSQRGKIIGALVVEDTDEILAILKSGKVIRSDVKEVGSKGRNTMGMVFVKLDADDEVISIAKNYERGLDPKSNDQEKLI